MYSWQTSAGPTKISEEHFQQLVEGNPEDKGWSGERVPKEVATNNTLYMMSQSGACYYAYTILIEMIRNPSTSLMKATAQANTHIYIWLPELDQRLKTSHNRIVRKCLMGTLVPLSYTSDTVG